MRRDPAKRDLLYLRDIIEAADAIAQFLVGSTPEAMSRDDLLRSAVLHKLTVIGEAAARLTPRTRSEHPQVPWADIVAMRNLAVHEYFAVDWEIVWVTATQDVPLLRSQVADVLAGGVPRSAG
jgi:uncharacterized protein with HEPN domain